MRNLKKALSLCLAFVMLLGLMMIGAGAAGNLDKYSDQNTIAENRKEAIDLLMALGILEGTDGGQFGPKENLQRDQAAKIVAWANLGKDANGSVAIPTTAPFSDIGPGSEWALPYIVYCKNLGIINGISLPNANGEVEYAPTAAVSGYQLAKMLLCVVGYGVNGEYTGGNWNMKVAVDAQVTGLTKGIETVNNDPISREDAAQMVFNALTMEMVAYSELYGTYSSEFHNALNPTLLGTKAEQVFNVRTMEQTDTDGTDYHFWRKIGTTTPITDIYDCDIIVEDNIYSSSAKALADKYDFAQGVEIWENGKAITADVYYLGDVKMEKSAALTAQTSDGTTLYVPSFRNNNSNVVAYAGQKITLVDEGAKCRYDTVYEVGSGSWNFGIPSGWTSSSLSKLTSNHTIVGGSNGAVDKIIVTTNYLAKVETGNKATVYAPTQDQKTFSVDLGADHGYTVGDYILVVPNVTLNTLVTTNAGRLSSNDKVLINTSLVKTTKATAISAATVTAYAVNAANNKGNGSVTTGGQTYKYNGVFANYKLDNSQVKVDDGAADKARAALGEKYTRATGDEFYVGRGSYTFYLDSNNNVIGVVENNSGIRDFAYIIEVGHDDFFYYNTVKAVLSDGTVGTYYLDPASDGYDNYGTAQTGSGTGGHNYVVGNISGNLPNGVRPGYMYSYSLNGNRIVLTDLDKSGTSNIDNQTYDVVKDIYNVEKTGTGSVRVSNVEANVTNGNAFTRGGSAFRYRMLNPASYQTNSGVTLTTNTDQYTNTANKNAWGAGERVAYATDTTVFTFVYGGQNDSTSIARYVGKNNAPSVLQDNNNPHKYSVSMVLRKDGNTNYIEYVVIRSNEAPNAIINENHFTVVSNRYTAVGSDTSNRPLYYYDVIINGAKKTIACYNANLSVGNVVTYTYDRNAFNGDSANGVEAGAYTTQTINDNRGGVLYNQFVDVDGAGLVAVVKTNANDATDNKNVALAGAKIWDLTRGGAEVNASEVRPTDRITVIFGSTYGQGENLVYNANEVFILSRYNTATLSGMEVKDAAGNVTGYEASGKNYYDVLANGWTLAHPLTVKNGADFYIDGNLTRGANNIVVEANAKLTVSGRVDTGVAGTITLGQNATIEIKDPNATTNTPGMYNISAGSGVTSATVIINGRTYQIGGAGWNTVISSDTTVNASQVGANDTFTVQNNATLTLTNVDNAAASEVLERITLKDGSTLNITNSTNVGPADLQDVLDKVANTTAVITVKATGIVTGTLDIRALARGCAFDLTGNDGAVLTIKDYNEAGAVADTVVTFDAVNNHIAFTKGSIVIVSCNVNSLNIGSNVVATGNVTVSNALTVASTGTLRIDGTTADPIVVVVTDASATVTIAGDVVIATGDKLVVGDTNTNSAPAGMTIATGATVTVEDGAAVTGDVTNNGTVSVEAGGTITGDLTTNSGATSTIDGAVTGGATGDGTTTGSGTVGGDPVTPAVTITAKTEGLPTGFSFSADKATVTVAADAPAKTVAELKACYTASAGATVTVKQGATDVVDADTLVAGAYTLTATDGEATATATVTVELAAPAFTPVSTTVVPGTLEDRGPTDGTTWTIIDKTTLGKLTVSPAQINSLNVTDVADLAGVTPTEVTVTGAIKEHYNAANPAVKAAWGGIIITAPTGATKVQYSQEKNGSWTAWALNNSGGSFDVNQTISEQGVNGEQGMSFYVQSGNTGKIAAQFLNASDEVVATYVVSVNCTGVTAAQ